jgi:hypothetical protein
MGVLFLTCFAIPFKAKAFTEKNGTLTQVAGEVKIWDHETQTWKAGTAGMPVEHGDQIQTGKDSYAVLQYDYEKCDISEVPSISTVAVSNPVPLSKPEPKASLAKARILKLKRCTEGTCTFSRPGVSPAIAVVGERRTAQFSKNKSWWGDTRVMK